ncbi:MAG: GNAT family N-acetyltransferase [bacterium]
MVTELVERTLDFARQHSDMGYLIAFGGTILASFGAPFPVELILLLGGAASRSAPLQLLAVIAAAFAGTNLGDGAMFLICRRLGNPAFVRYGRYVFLSQEKIDRAMEFFDRWGGGVIIANRYIIGPKIPYSIVSGILRMSSPKFFFYNVLGAFPWAVAYPVGGYLLGEHWEVIRQRMWVVGVCILAIVALGVGIWLWMGKRRPVGPPSEHNSPKKSELEGPRGTHPDEFRKVLFLVNSVFRGQGLMEKRFPLLFDERNLDNLRIVLDGGVPISHVGIRLGEIVLGESWIRVGSIGSVCTHPRYRGRGIATSLMEDAVRKLRSEGASLMLVSGRRGLYRRLGCTEAAPTCEFKIRRRDLRNLGTSDLSIGPCEEGDIETLLGLHEREEVRFRRTLDEFKLLLGALPYGWGRGIPLALRRQGELLGYIVVRIGGIGVLAQMGEVPLIFDFLPYVVGRICFVVEYGGSREVVLSAIRPIFEEYGVGAMSLSVPLWDAEMLSLMRERGFASTAVDLRGHTLKVLDLPGLIRGLRPYFEERRIKVTAGEDGSRFVLAISGEEFPIEGEENLTKFIFGTAEGSGPTIHLSGEMGDLLRSLFPIPFPIPGLNYI